MLSRISKFLEGQFTEFLVSISPFVGSLIPALFLFVNLRTVMELPWPFAVVIAIAAESIGVGAVAMYFSARQFNARYRDDKNHVSTWPPIAAYSIYLVAIFATNVLLESGGWHNPNKLLISLSKLALSLFGVAGALLIATNHAINAVIEKNKRPVKADNSAAKADSGEDNGAVKTDSGADSVRSVSVPVRSVSVEVTALPVYAVKSKSELTDEMITHLQNGHNPKTLAAMFPKVLPHTLRRWKRELKTGS